MTNNVINLEQRRTTMQQELPRIPHFKEKQVSSRVYVRRREYDKKYEVIKLMRDPSVSRSDLLDWQGPRRPDRTPLVGMRWITLRIYGNPAKAVQFAERIA